MLDQKAAGATYDSFMLESVSSTMFVAFNSDEAAVNRPELVLWYAIPGGRLLAVTPMLNPVPVFLSAFAQ